ncbi:hypothetical protein HPB49_009431 [Dermacentor silvarum]|uniref:Uncharacterized protein n=1 Tax=Dermacentor silvarum TaxID=543639 RepID=A0ACB8DYL6_DERSI|nr:hypothetical protein HPB49_009431 [Dermacentor silvarum]
MAVGGEVPQAYTVDLRRSFSSRATVQELAEACTTELAEHSSDLQNLVTVAADHLRRLGLHFNARKSAILQFSGTEEDIDVRLPGGGSIPVSDQYRYLGVNFHASAVLFDKQDEHVRQASVRAANVLRRRSLWGCNKFVLVRELWKAIHVPVLTFANAVICLSAETRQWLERGQRGVGRLALGCHGRVAVEAIQGDLGWSSFEAREARSKAAYEGRLRLMNNERWARRVFRYTSLKGVSTQWSRRLYSLCRKFSLFSDPVQEDSERKWSMEVRTRVQEAETSMWQSAMDQKSSLALYRVHKTTISVERLYDNSAGSALLFETRAGALRTKVYRRRFDQSVDDSTVQCRACGDDEENIEHIVLRSEEPLVNVYRL